jgi:hypothetical protein
MNCGACARLSPGLTRSHWQIRMDDEIEKAVVDILTFALGLRPLLTEDDMRALVKRRLEKVANAQN